MFKFTNLLAASAVLCAGALALTSTGLMPSPFSGAQEMETPTKHHEEMLKAVGEWKGKITMHGPGMEGQEMVAKETVTAIGPFWTTTDFQGDFMGFPFAGRAVMGYDAKSKKAVGTWCDSTSSFMAVMEGTIADDGTVTMKWDAPWMDAGMAPHRSVTKNTGDSYTSEFHVTLDGKEIHTMTIAMDRVKEKKGQ